jgi:hypothetical protein
MLLKEDEFFFFKEKKTMDTRFLHHARSSVITITWIICGVPIQWILDTLT